MVGSYSEVQNVLMCVLRGIMVLCDSGKLSAAPAGAPSSTDYFGGACGSSLGAAAVGGGGSLVTPTTPPPKGDQTTEAIL